MIIKGIILLLFCLCLFLTMLITIVLAIVKRRDKKIRNCSILIAVLSLIVLLSSGVYLSIKTFGVIKNKASNSSDIVDASLSDYFSGNHFDEKNIGVSDIPYMFMAAFAEHFSGRHFDSEYLDSIKSMQPTDRAIPSPYYYCAGFRDYYRMPLIYPYSLIAIDDFTYGTIEDESDVENVFVSANAKNDIVSGITEFAFDEKYLVAKLESFADKDYLEYIVLDFKTAELKRFETEEQMKVYTQEIGFDITRPMITPKEYYAKF